MPARGKLKEPTRRILEFTRLAHQEYLSQRRVLEAGWGTISDEEWFTMEFQFLNPQELLDLPDSQRFQKPNDLWTFWVAMMTLGPPSVHGALRKLQKREDLRRIYQRHTSSDVIPSNSTLDNFFRRMGKTSSTFSFTYQSKRR